MSAPSASAAETFSLAHLLSVLDAKESVGAPWVGRAGLRVDPAALSVQICSAIGAVVTLSQNRSVKKHFLTDLFDELLSEDRRPEDWMVVLRYRQAPTIETPPLRVDVTGPMSARPVIFDPLTLIERLRSLEAD